MDLNLDLTQRAAEWKSTGLWRELRTLDSPQNIEVVVNGKPYLNFSSNDYLGLAFHPALAAAATEAIAHWGTGTGASRLICGNTRIQQKLDETLADFKGTEAALSFGSGYATALGAIPALVGKGDTVIADKLSHACLIDAARLSGATLRIFPHNDLDYLERLLQRTRGRRIILTESVFSMDGDQAPLAEIVRQKEKYGAWLMVDEAHGTGLFGNEGSGLIQHLGLTQRVDLHMGTLGKALGSSGGFLAGSRLLIDWLINRARSVVYSTAPPPAASAASMAALRLCRSSEGETLRQQVWDNVRWLQREFPQLAVQPSPILPWICGDNTTALNCADALAAQGILAPAIRYPTVPKNRARIRFTVSAKHQTSHLQKLRTVLRAVFP